MPFQILEKHGGHGELVGAVVSKSKDGRTLYLTLGQDVVERFCLHDEPYLEVYAGTGRDEGKLLLARSSKDKGYRCGLDETGKGRLAAVQPKVVSTFCNGHKKIHCTVYPHEQGILLIGNGRGNGSVHVSP